MNIHYPLASDTWDKLEIDAINRVVASNRFSMGYEVAEFEREFATYFGAKFAVMVNSGSSANLIAIAAVVLSEKYDLKAGDEVIVPAVSWSTTYSVLQQYGLKLRFIDIDINTLNMDISKLEKAITQNTKAIFAVNLLGNPNDFNPLIEICERKNLILLEDNCESMGAIYNGKYTGTFGIVGTFSTFYSHHMATMEGGMVLTNDAELNDIMISIRAHGWTRQLREESTLHIKRENKFYEMFNFILPGYNVRPIEMEAAIGREQLKKLSGFLKNRVSNGEYFIDKFSNRNDLLMQKTLGESSFFGFSIILKEQGKRDDLVKKLSENGVECRPIVAGNFTRNDVIKYFDYTIFENLDAANYLHDNGFFIGNHHYNCRDKINLIYNLI
jgi:dTDP-4-amino-4,6-dideoxygalactose transaminase